MRCISCGADLAEGTKPCPACGAAVPFGSKVVGETTRVATETGAIVGKIGKGAIGGLKGFVRGAKKSYRGEGAEPAEPTEEQAKE